MRFNASQVRTAFACAATAAGFALLAWLGVALAAREGQIAPLWLPNALLLGVLLRDRRGRAGVLALSCLLTNIVMNLLLGLETTSALAFAFANVAEAALAASMVRRWCGRAPDLSDLSDLSRFSIVAGLAAPTFSGAVVGLLSLNAGLSAWATWSATDALGLLIGAPIVMAVIDGWREPRWPDRRGWIEGACVLAIGWSAVAGVFAQSRYPLLFLVGPLVLVIAFRMSSFGVALFVAGVTAIGTAASATGHGPIALVQQDALAKLLILQLFFATIFALGLPVSALINGLARARAQLRAAHDFTETMVRNMREVVFRTDAHGRWVFLNPAWETMTGYTVAESLDRPATRLLESTDLQEAQRFHAQILSGDVSEALLERRFRRADGEMRDVEVSIRALWTEDGRFDGSTGNIRDVSERKTLIAALESARDAAEVANRAKATFLAHMSHEIRTPMNGVLGFTELLAAGPLGAGQEEPVRMLGESGRTLMRLLDDILDLSKIEAGELSVIAEPVEPRRAIDACVRLMAPVASGKAVLLDWRVDGDVPDRLLSDELRLGQILLNLVGNALKFTARGTVIVQARMAGADTVAIDVLDTGIGIAADRLHEIFEPFRQGDPTTTRRFGGTGLGLTISRQLAVLLGGELSVESQPGQGSCFTLTLPARVVAMQAEPVARAPASRRNGPTPRVLLAEDHEINQLLTGGMLERLGCRVELARDGVEAVALVGGAGEDPFALVLMDVQMPNLDGLAATRLLRAEGWTPAELPIVALSANAGRDDVAACLLAGMQAHIAKPVQLAGLADAVARWTGYARAEAA